MLNMMAAGHETTASALQWATYAMMKYPESQTRLRNEILGLLNTNPQLGYTEIESLTYLNNFCREILRVWCPGRSYLLLLLVSPATYMQTQRSKSPGKQQKTS